MLMTMARLRRHNVNSAIELRGLYAITPEDALLPRLSALVGLALKGGTRLVQYRTKLPSPSLRRAQADELLRICRASGARLIINDDLNLALDSGADGVHLGSDDGDIAAARIALGPTRILGVSCYNDIERASLAADAGADYLAVGSVFASSTKPTATRASMEMLAETKRRFGKPVVAIGGITVHNARTVISAGADMVAVITDLFDAMDIAARATSFQQLFTEHK
jgi:thiamine-phosphate pyrophosphorylase